MKSKTIILSNEKEKGRGILTILQEEDILQCRIRLYNIEKLNKYCKIGIYHENQVYSANLLEKDGVYTSSMVGDFDLNQDFYSAIINTQNNNEVILSGGTYAGFVFNDYEVFDQIDQPNTKTNLYEYPETETQNISESLSNTSCENCQKCANCIYRQHFFEEQSDKQNQTTSEEIEKITKIELNENIQTNLNKQQLIEQENLLQTQSDSSQQITEDTKIKTTLESITTQFNYAFENYPTDEVLCSLLPNSKFVKIEEKSNSYSIGAIFQDEEIKFICYATLCNYNSPAPLELGEHYQWLPIDKEDPLSEGYYIVFQDAQDLKIVEL